jgi:hypothetical protein
LPRVWGISGPGRGERHSLLQLWLDLREQRRDGGGIWQRWGVLGALCSSRATVDISVETLLNRSTERTFCEPGILREGLVVHSGTEWESLKSLRSGRLGGSTSSVEKEGLKNSTCVKGEALVRGSAFPPFWGLCKEKERAPSLALYHWVKVNSGLIGDSLPKRTTPLVWSGCAARRESHRRWTSSLLPEKSTNNLLIHSLLRRRRLTLVPQCPNWNCGSLCCQLEERTPVIGRADKGEAHTA